MATILGCIKWHPSEMDKQIIQKILELSNSYDYENVHNGPSKYSLITDDCQVAVKVSGFFAYLFFDYYKNNMKSFFFDCRQILDRYNIENLKFQLHTNSYLHPLGSDIQEDFNYPK